MTAQNIATIEDVTRAAEVVRLHMSPAPLIRSYVMEELLKLPSHRRVWIKDYGWTPVGSFKLMGALNWMHQHLDEIGDRPVAAHSSGNFAAGIAFAGQQYQRRVIIVMPDTAPQIKFDRTRSLGAEIRTYAVATDHETGQRDRLTREIAEVENAVQASPYDDNDVISGNGVGGLEIVEELKTAGREISHFVCPVSGGGLMAGHALAIADGFPEAKIIGVEPSGAADFAKSIAFGQRERLEKPRSICDGLLSYDVGHHNWPILKQLVSQAVAIDDSRTKHAMKWLWQQHGLRTEPSGAISSAVVLDRFVDLDGDGDIVIVLSGRNVDDDKFFAWLDEV